MDNLRAARETELRLRLGAGHGRCIKGLHVIERDRPKGRFEKARCGLKIGHG
jgi:hypothetical protein